MKTRHIAFTATVAAAALFVAPTANAQDWHGHGHHDHHDHHGWIGPGFVGGVALGALAAPYAYAPRCWYERQIVIDRRGREVVRNVRVCN